ncbi:RNA-guided endonuclease InsQ/TnpB family protein [Helicobacter pylori]|uniref:RNA-guided endonuclease InsQ/TnpB family protein n=3 Tax=Helicobacter pylori TaxID=210 RepID=UPI0003865E2F|nr:RNA-guided endonuclease TnpB family protein [Helicobacter pylori]EPZ73357.1 transposase IS605 [Helicobacter pylori UM111]
MMVLENACEFKEYLWSVFDEMGFYGGFEVVGNNINLNIIHKDNNDLPTKEQVLEKFQENIIKVKKQELENQINAICKEKIIKEFRSSVLGNLHAYDLTLEDQANLQENYQLGIKTNHLQLKKEFNALKKSQFNFVYEVTKYATQQPFIHLNLAFNKFFRDLKKGLVSYPKFKKKREFQGSFYIGGDQIKIIQTANTDYLKIPNLPPIKLTEKLRFQGKINNATITQKGDHFYVSISCGVDESEYKRTHKLQESHNKLGIDTGIKSFVSLSNGLNIYAPKPLDKLTRKLVRISRQLSKKIHPKTKGDKTKKSNNYLKHSKKLTHLHEKIANIRLDFLHKLTSSLIRHSNSFCLESLKVKNMFKNHRLAKSLSDVSMSVFNTLLEYKAKYSNKEILRADTYYPSSKTCSNCQKVKQDLKLKDRIYQCLECGFELDRDINAAINLLKHLVGRVTAEFTPMDLTALLNDLSNNRLVTSKVELGIQQKS